MEYNSRIHRPRGDRGVHSTTKMVIKVTDGGLSTRFSATSISKFKRERADIMMADEVLFEFLHMEIVGHVYKVAEKSDQVSLPEYMSTALLTQEVMLRK